VNSITRILNKVFGKKVGVSLLRNIYLTDKYSNKVEDLKEDAEAMGTSSNTILNNYVKVDESK
jgi:chorismate-pyruvate lyase